MKRHVLATLASIFATLLLGIGIAVAVEGDGGSTPPASDSVSSSHSSADDESSESDDTETEAADESTASDTDSAAHDSTTHTAGEHPENHGKYVSQAAHDCPTGSEHGPCVSAVAKSDVGKPQK